MTVLSVRDLAAAYEQAGDLDQARNPRAIFDDDLTIDQPYAFTHYRKACNDLLGDHFYGVVVRRLLDEDPSRIHLNVSLEHFPKKHPITNF